MYATKLCSGTREGSQKVVKVAKKIDDNLQVQTLQLFIQERLSYTTAI